MEVVRAKHVQFKTIKQTVPTTYSEDDFDPELAKIYKEVSNKISSSIFCLASQYKWKRRYVACRLCSACFIHIRRVRIRGDIYCEARDTNTCTKLSLSVAI